MWRQGRDRGDRGAGKGKGEDRGQGAGGGEDTQGSRHKLPINHKAAVACMGDARKRYMETPADTLAVTRRKIRTRS